MNEVFDSFKKSLQRLEEVLKEQKTIVTRDSAIKRFEFTVELAWKSIQQCLRTQEIICRSPKQCLEEAFKFGLIKDDPVWTKIIDDRNLTVHTYNEDLAEKIYTNISQYIRPLKSLLLALESRK